MKAFLLLFVVGLTHYGYIPLSSGPQEESWVFYIFRGIEGTVLFSIVAYELRESKYAALALFACFIGAAEEAQTAVCGALQYGNPEYTPAGLCVSEFGIFPYAAVLAAIIVIWRGKYAREN